MQLKTRGLFVRREGGDRLAGWGMLNKALFISRLREARWDGSTREGAAKGGQSCVDRFRRLEMISLFVLSSLRIWGWEGMGGGPGALGVGWAGRC
jgi:hypothetical protein